MKGYMKQFIVAYEWLCLSFSGKDKAEKKDYALKCCRYNIMLLS